MLKLAKSVSTFTFPTFRIFTDRNFRKERKEKQRPGIANISTVHMPDNPPEPALHRNNSGDKMKTRD